MRDRWGRAAWRIVVNDNRCREIWIGASGRDPQHDFVSVFEPCDRVVGFSDYLDDDSCAALRLDRADAYDRRRFLSEQRPRRNRDTRVREFDPEFSAVRTEIEPWSWTAESEM